MLSGTADRPPAAGGEPAPGSRPAWVPAVASDAYEQDWPFAPIYCATRPLPFTPPKPIAPTPEDLRGSTILVVDDERAWRVILETDLRMLGYKVSMAEDADQALEKARIHGNKAYRLKIQIPTFCFYCTCSKIGLPTLEAPA